MAADWWRYWDPNYGYRGTEWFAEYRRERAARPLKEGRQRRAVVSVSREVLRRIVEAAAPVRWQRLGRWTFSWPAWLCYAALIGAAIVVMVRDRSLRPSYHAVFFTDHLSLIPITLTVVQIPCILVHEGFHALSAVVRSCLERRFPA